FTFASYSSFSLRLRTSAGTVRSATTVPVATSPSATKINVFKILPFELRGNQVIQIARFLCNRRCGGAPRYSIFVGAHHLFVRRRLRPAQARYGLPRLNQVRV